MANRIVLTLLATALSAPLVAPASAQTFRRGEPYAGVSYLPGSNGDPSYAGDFVRGTYIGAPLTRVPRPTQIVPAPWSYGTYGIPTVTGIPAAPAAEPTLTVINAAPSGRRGQRAAGNGPAAGARIIAVQVPRR